MASRAISAVAKLLVK